MPGESRLGSGTPPLAVHLRRAHIVGCFALIAAASIALRSPKLLINGSETEHSVLEWRGERWVPLRALEKAGAEVHAFGDRVSVRFPQAAGTQPMNPPNFGQDKPQLAPGTATD